MSTRESTLSTHGSGTFAGGFFVFLNELDFILKEAHPLEEWIFEVHEVICSDEADHCDAYEIL